MGSILKLFTILMVLICTLSTTHAYIITKTGTNSDRKHIFVIGRAGELGDLFLRSVQTKMLRYKDLYPNDQLIMIGVAELHRKRSFIQNNFKMTIVKSDRKRLTAKRLVKILQGYQNIKSIDFFSHSGAAYGISLEKNEPLKYSQSENMAALKKVISPDTYIVFNGCNSGFLQAPMFSEILGIPVFGSLTSTDFHKIH